MKKFKLNWQHFVFVILIIAILGAFVHYINKEEDIFEGLETMSEPQETKILNSKKFQEESGVKAPDPKITQINKLTQKRRESKTPLNVESVSDLKKKKPLDSRTVGKYKQSWRDTKLTKKEAAKPLDEESGLPYATAESINEAENMKNVYSITGGQDHDPKSTSYSGEQVQNADLETVKAFNPKLAKNIKAGASDITQGANLGVDKPTLAKLKLRDSLTTDGHSFGRLRGNNNNKVDTGGNIVESFSNLTYAPVNSIGSLGCNNPLLPYQNYNCGPVDVNNIFGNIQFRPECCGNPAGSSYSNSMGCACICPEQLTFLNSRGGNRTFPSEF